VRKSTVLMCVSTLALASCSTIWTWPWESGPAGPANPRKILVSVADGQIRVDQETSVVRTGNDAVLWDLAPSAWRHRLGSGAIRFQSPAAGAPTECRSTPDPAELFDLTQCKPSANGKQFACPKRDNHQPGACFRYTLTLEPLAGSTAVPATDRWLISE